jgi:hypothetical protein
MCRAEAAELRPRAEEFERAGAKLALIGNGWPAMAKDFAQKTGFPPSVAVLTDPSKKSYDLAGFKHSAVLTLLNPKSMLRAARAFREGLRQGRTAGDPFQQGGSLVVRPGGKVVFRHVSWGPGDHAGADTLLAALNTAH